MVEKSITDRARAAYRADAERTEAESGPSLKATKNGVPIDSSLKRLDSDGHEVSDGDRLDKILNHLGALHQGMTELAARCDALEGKRGAADSDGDDQEEGLPSDGSQEGDPRPLMADSQRRTCRDSDQGNSKRTPLLAQRDGDEKPIDATLESRAAAAEFQSRADSAFQSFSVADSAPRWLQGESLTGYKQRLLSKLKTHSSGWRDVNLYNIRERAALDTAADMIFADSIAYAKSPSSVPEGRLRQVIETDATGRKISRFYGDPEATWGMFKSQSRRLVGINTKPQG